MAGAIAGTWTTPHVEAERQVVLDLIQGMAGDPEQALGFCLDQVLAKDGVSLVRKLLFAMQALQIHTAHGGLAPGQISKIVDIATSILRLANIRPTTSKMSFLYGELFDLLGRAYLRDGRTVEALWEAHIAQMLSRAAPVGERGRRILFLAERSLRLGHATLALEQMELAREVGLADEDQEQEEELRLQALIRLSDASAEALKAGLVGRAGLDSARRARIEWVTRREVVRAGGDFAVFFAAGTAADALPSQRAEIWLWSHAVAAEVWMRQVPSAKATVLGLSDAVLVKACQIIEQAYDTKRPLDQRLRSVQKMLVEASRLGSIEHELLVLAASARWLIRFNQMDLAVALLADYRAASKKVSGGRSEDFLGVLVDAKVATLLRRYQGA